MQFSPIIGIIRDGEFNSHPRTWKWPGISARDDDFFASGRKKHPRSSGYGPGMGNLTPNY